MQNFAKINHEVKEEHKLKNDAFSARHWHQLGMKKQHFCRVNRITYV